MSYKRADELQSQQGYVLVNNLDDVIQIFKEIKFKNMIYVSAIVKQEKGEYLEIWGCSKPYPNEGHTFWQIYSKKEGLLE